MVKNNFFHHFREQKTASEIRISGKSCQNQYFCTTQAVLEAQIVEKVVFDNFHNFFHFFHEFLRKSLESSKWWKKWSKTTFSTIFVNKKTASEIRISGKSCQNQYFCTTQAVLEAQNVEKVVFDNFFHFFHEFLRKSLES